MTEEPRIRIPSLGGTSGRNGFYLNVEGLTQPEQERLEASLCTGHHWVRRGEGGRLEHVPSFEELPGPTTDESMLPFWRRPKDGEVKLEETFGFDAETERSIKHHSPSIYISYLCGYNYTPEGYKRQADQLTKWGFVCMRSPRDPNSGRYSERWHLLSLLLAKGTLEDFLDEDREADREKKLKAALKFIGRNASFGTLDVVVQKMAMAID